ncbi:Acireductone dioxygenase [Heracleum sosnowskyi]|uniref:acireductone dioxygenase (Fe(2+)-requiring) n=1 Tax=Heracleum sosnowskyi TaxID=360622 RepID=A0AAD8ILT6_9APIA|nr:Acireductone dioxygenase [Heracleum sosnowskyi]
MQMGSTEKDDREEVLQAWYMDDSDEDQQLPHHRNPMEFVSLEKLSGLSNSSPSLSFLGGYYDVRDINDRWIRVMVKKGGMIILPAGMYHRFTLDANNHVKVMRLFVGDPIWTPYSRPHDHLPARKEYLESFVHKAAANTSVDATA